MFAIDVEATHWDLGGVWISRRGVGRGHRVLISVLDRQGSVKGGTGEESCFTMG